MVKENKQLPMENQLGFYRGAGITGVGRFSLHRKQRQSDGQRRDRTCQNQASIMFLSHASVTGKPHLWGLQGVFMLWSLFKFSCSLIEIESRNVEVS